MTLKIASPMPMYVVAFTGHRPDKLNNEYDGLGPVSNHLRWRINEELRKIGVTDVISGMALGVDMLAAEVALSMGIPVWAYVPFKGQEAKWPMKSRLRYYDILAQCQVNYICEGVYSAWKMQKRNEAMVNDCDILIAVWDESEGGTANCVKYAKKVEKPIIYINPKMNN